MLAHLLIAFFLRAATPVTATSPAPERSADRSTAIVRGRVLAADTGAPLKYAHITLRMNGVTRETASVTADSNGAYELRNVDPGTYVPWAGKAGFVNTSYKGPDDVNTVRLAGGQVLTGIDFRLPRAAVISGTVTDIDGEPVANANISAMVKVYRQGKVELQNRGSNTQTNDRGEYRLHDLPAGRYFLQAAKNASSGQGIPLARQIYSNATRMEDAQPVRVNAGEEREGINFTLHDAQSMIFSGRIINAETGQPLEAFLNMFPTNWSNGGTNANGRSTANGTFRFADVTPGLYMLMINVFNNSNGTMIPSSTQRYIEVGPSSNDVTIRVTKGITIKGQLKAEGGDLPEKLSLSLVTRLADGNAMSNVSATSGADGKFEFKNVQPGTYEFNVGRGPVLTPAQRAATTEPPKPMRFFVGPVVAGGQDAMDEPFVVREDAQSMEIAATIDFRAGSISGRILDMDEKPLRGTNLAIVSADPKKRLLTHYWRGFKSDKDGHYEAWNLIPGDYFLVVWPGEEVGQVLDPEVFTMLEKQAVKLKVSLGDKLTQDLHLTKELKTIADTFSQ